MLCRYECSLDLILDGVPGDEQDACLEMFAALDGCTSEPRGEKELKLFASLRERSAFSVAVVRN